MSLLMYVGTQYSIVYGVKYSHQQKKHTMLFKRNSFSNNGKMWRNSGNSDVKDFEGYAYGN